MANLTILTPPTQLPVSAEQVMAAARVEDESALEQFERLIRSATELVQEYSGCQLLEAEYRLDLPCWGDRMLLLPRSNRADVTSIYYRPSSGGPLTLWDAAQYQVVSRRNGISEIVPQNPYYWPPLVWQSVDAVQVTYTSGSPTVAELPPHAATAVEQFALYLYEHPSGGCPIPAGVMALLQSFTLRSAALDCQMAREPF